MYLVLYTDVVRDCTEIKGDITVNGNHVTWPKGQMTIASDFALVDDPVNVGDTVTDELLATDRKNDFLKVDEMDLLKTENEKLRNDMEKLVIEMTTLMTMP